MRRRFVLGAATALLGLASASASAQGNCVVVSSGTQNTVNLGTAQEMTYVTVPVISCAGGRRISADNAYVTAGSGIVRLMGNVQFQDADRTLRAANADYYSNTQRLSATGAVVLVHRATNSTIRSEQLEYTAASGQRPAHVQAMGGQPIAIFRQEGQRDSTILRAQQIDIFDDDRLRGTGDANLQRDSLVAMAYVIEYTQSARRLDLSGLRTQVDLPRYRLIADSTTVTLSEDDEIQDVFARHNASLDAEEMDVTAAAIRLFFEDGGIARMVAMQWTPRPGADAAGQAHVVNAQFNMTADSVDVLAPQQRLHEAAAIGRAHVERITPDSLRQYLPQADAETMRLIANDWMRGDTVRAFFAAPAEGGDAVLDRLSASGAPAQAMHRMRPENAAADAGLSIAYLIGQHVQVTFVAGVVSVVSASEDVRGVYLQPSDAARRTANQPATRRSGGAR